SGRPPSTSASSPGCCPSSACPCPSSPTAAHRSSPPCWRSVCCCHSPAANRAPRRPSPSTRVACDPRSPCLPAREGNEMTSILLAGGGTTGHISPMLAIGRELRRVHPDWDVVALGTPDGSAVQTLRSPGCELPTLDKGPMPRSLSRAPRRCPGRFWSNLPGAQRIISSRSLSAVVGVGGYVCPPAFLAARLAKIPL